jgi:hypothetical protein
LFNLQIYGIMLLMTDSFNHVDPRIETSLGEINQEALEIARLAPDAIYPLPEEPLTTYSLGQELDGTRSVMVGYDPTGLPVVYTLNVHAGKSVAGNPILHGLMINEGIVNLDNGFEIKPLYRVGEGFAPDADDDGVELVVGYLSILLDHLKGHADELSVRNPGF